MRVCNALRAFDKTVRRKPLAFAADAVYGNSIDLELEVIAKKVVAQKAWLLMLVNVLLPTLTPVMVRPGCSSFKRRYACTYTRGSVRRASGFVLTGYPETELFSVWKPCDFGPAVEGRLFPSRRAT